MNRLGVLGGTFDPVHFGHLDVAEAARTSLRLEQVLFVPASDPPHRKVEPQENGFQRFALVALAINGCAAYRVSDMELTRGGHSYTADTLRALHRDGWTPSQLFFILGTDAFAEIATWREFPSVLDAAQFVVIARPGTTPESALSRLPELRARVRPTTGGSEVLDRTAIYLVEAHTRDVSSTAIRSRLAAGASIDDLVPSPVARHIVAHHLYGAGRELA
jgi:nicotinate-nucleotide adenylyltransferase